MDRKEKRESYVVKGKGRNLCCETEREKVMVNWKGRGLWCERDREKVMLWKGKGENYDGKEKGVS